MKYPKIREIKEAVSSLLSPAYTTGFPAVQHHPAPRYRGKPVVNEEGCVGCEACSHVCPSGAITISDNLADRVRTIRRDSGKCIFCGLCETHCITHEGVKLSDQLYDLAVFDRDILIEVQERELITCRNCGAIITTRDHMAFMHHKLGPKAYSNILDLNLLNERLRLAPENETAVEIRDHLKRKDMFNVLCPNCLRRVLLNELL